MISIILTRYGESNKIVGECLTSISKQRYNISIEVLYLEQKPSLKIKKMCKDLHFTYIEIPQRGLSWARNYGIKKAKYNTIIFTDTDCIWKTDLVENLSKSFKKHNANIIGCKILPKWNGKHRCYHKSTITNEFYSLLNLGDKTIKVNKIVGACFAINKKSIGKEAYFDEKLGRVNGKLFGGEETDLCERVGKVYYCGKAVSYHQVSNDRMKLKWLLKRAYMGGLSRARRGGKVQSFHKERKIIDYLTIFMILPFYVSGYISGKLDK